MEGEKKVDPDLFSGIRGQSGGTERELKAVPVMGCARAVLMYGTAGAGGQGPGKQQSDTKICV